MHETIMSEGESCQLSVKWNKFHSDLTSGLYALLQEGDLVDVTLAAGGQFVQAHKVVLSACSPYFQDIFKVNPCPHPTVILKDVCHKDLVAIVQFMYLGEVTVQQEGLETFLKTAEMLRVKGLTGDNSLSEEESILASHPTIRTRAPRRTSEKVARALFGTPEMKQPVTDAPNAEPEEMSAPPYNSESSESSSTVFNTAMIVYSSGEDFIEMTNQIQEPAERETEIEEVERPQNRDDPLLQLPAAESSQTHQYSSQVTPYKEKRASIHEGFVELDSGRKRRRLNTEVESRVMEARSCLIVEVPGSTLVSQPPAPLQQPQHQQQSAGPVNVVTTASDTLPTSTPVDQDPFPDFQPVIPMPPEVALTTGEEEEAILFENKSRLFRYVDKEWKDLGMGTMKLLHNQKTGKVRVLMRRKHVLKICANHFVRSDMELAPKTDRAWAWVTPDFVHSEFHLEQFCVKFKTSDEAASFKDAFDKARVIVAAAEMSPVKAASC